MLGISIAGILLFICLLVLWRIEAETLRERQNTRYYSIRVDKSLYICREIEGKLSYLSSNTDFLFDKYDRSKQASTPFFRFTDKITEASLVHAYNENKDTRRPYEIWSYAFSTPDEFKQAADENKARIIVDMLSGKFEQEIAKYQQELQLKKEKEAAFREQQLLDKFRKAEFLYESEVFPNTQITSKAKRDEILRLTPLLIEADARKDEEAVGKILLEMEAVIR